MKKIRQYKRFFCVAMIAALTLSVTPSTVYASDEKTVAAEMEETESGSENVGLPESEEVNESNAEEAGEAAEEKETEVPASEELTDDLAGEKELESAQNLEMASRASAYIYRVDYDQTEINKKNVTVSLPGAAKLLSMKVADEVRIKAVLTYNGKVYQKLEKSVKLNELGDRAEVEVEFPTFGKYVVATSFYKNGSVVSTTGESIVGVVAEEYNFADLNATFPVVQFTLSLWDMKGTSENPVPTFVALSRSDAYDWTCLPENVYELPYIGANNRENVGFTNKIRMTANFIKELYELNPDSKFNLYCVDYTSTAILYTLIENNIPIDQCSIRILSDGTASYTFFNERFNVKNPQAVYNAMAVEWNNLRKEYANGKEIPLDSLKYSTSSDTSSLKYYTYVIANEEKKKGADIEWWLARTDGTLLSPDADFLATACRTVDQGGVIRLTAFNTMLQNLQKKGPEVEREFKVLYHFSETMFSDAEANNRKVMMLLGTRVNLEQNFEDYARFCKLYYGDEYEYYYKGHPATPTDMYPEKQVQLNTLGMHDVESSIAAELILYFYPNISMSGYDSTTFMSASKETACCLFGKTLDQAYNVTNGCDYKNTIDTCVSPISDYKNGIGKMLNSEHRNYLVEFNKRVSDSDYDVAVWDATDVRIYYYVANANGTYTLKDTNVASSLIANAVGKTRSVSLSWNSMKGADEYRVYGYDPATKKYTGLKRLTGTSCTFTGLKDGTKYTYLVRARVNGIWSSYTSANHVAATTICAKPSFTVNGSNKAVTVSWKAVPGATKYRVYSFSNDTNKYTKLDETTETSIVYKGLEDGEDYTYLVRAYNGMEFSPFTRKDNVTGITLCIKPSVIANATTNTIKLSWGSVSGAERYRVYAYNKATKTYKGIANVTGNSYEVRRLGAGTEYTYLVRAYNGKAYSSYSRTDNISCKTLCSKPYVKSSVKGKTLTLTWGAVKGATKYRVYSYNASTGKYTRLGDVKGTKYVIDGVIKNRTYRYLVRAYNGTSFSSYSKKDVVSRTVR